MTDAEDTMESPSLHVVFGTGQVGSQLVDRLLARGQHVRSVRRSAEVGRHPMHQTVRADLLDREATIRAAAGASVVYHCANAPYHEWPSKLPPICRHIAAAAQAARARLIVLDNVYAVGATGSFDENTPERPRSRKGALRKQLADELRALHARGELSVTIGRASDFFGPHVDQGVLQHPRAMDQLLAGKTVDVIGALDQPHSWSYAPDVAEGLLRLGMRPDLGGQTLHLPVLPPQTAGAMLALLAKELGVPHHARRMPPWMLRVAGWFSPLMRELPEMQYQFDAPFVMLDDQARRVLAMEPTPLDEQIRATAAWMRERSRTSAGTR